MRDSAQFIREVAALMVESNKLTGTRCTWPGLVKALADEGDSDVREMVAASGAMLNDVRRLLGLPPDEREAEERAKELTDDAMRERANDLDAAREKRESYQKADEAEGGGL